MKRIFRLLAVIATIACTSLFYGMAMAADLTGALSLQGMPASQQAAGDLALKTKGSTLIGNCDFQISDCGLRGKGLDRYDQSMRFNPIINGCDLRLSDCGLGRKDFQWDEPSKKIRVLKDGCDITRSDCGRHPSLLQKDERAVRPFVLK